MTPAADVGHPWYLRVLRASVFVYAILVTAAWIILGLAYQYRSDVLLPPPFWGGYCEAKAVGTAVLEPINSWTSLTYIIFSAFVTGVCAEYRILLGVSKYRAENAKTLRRLIFRPTPTQGIYNTTRFVLFGLPFPLDDDNAAGADGATDGKQRASREDDRVDAMEMRRVTTDTDRTSLNADRWISTLGEAPHQQHAGQATLAVPGNSSLDGHRSSSNDSPSRPSSEPLRRSSADHNPTPAELRQVFTVSVADFDPEDLNQLHTSAGTYQVELRWSFRASWICPILYTSVGVVLGFGSFLFHARFDTPSALADFAGMMGLSAFAFGYAVARQWYPGRCGDRSDEWDDLLTAKRYCIKSFRGPLFLLVTVLTFLFGFLLRVYSPIDFTQELFAGFLGSAIVLEVVLVVLRVRYNVPDDTHTQSSMRNLARNHIILLIIAFSLFGVAFGLWFPDTNRAPGYCDPFSWFQGHSWWHILTAIAYYFLFAYYYSESSAVYIQARPRGPPTAATA